MKKVLVIGKKYKNLDEEFDLMAIEYSNRSLEDPVVTISCPKKNVILCGEITYP